MKLLKSEWIVIVGESLVTVGSLVFVIGLLRAFCALLGVNREFTILRKPPNKRSNFSTLLQKNQTLLLNVKS